MSAKRERNATPGQSDETAQPGSFYMQPAVQNPPLPSAPANAAPPAFRSIQPTAAELHRHEIRSRMTTPRGLALTLTGFLFVFFLFNLVLLGWTWGLGVTLLALIYCVASFVLFYKKSPQPNKYALWLYAPILIIAAGFFLHYNPMSHAPMTITLVVLVFLQLVMFTSPDRREVFKSDMATTTIQRIVLQPLFFLFAPFKTFTQFRQIKSKKLRKILLIVLGLFLALPVCAILLGWFRSADAAFADNYTRIADYFNQYFEVKWGKLFLSAFFAALFGGPLAAILLYNDADSGENKEPKYKNGIASSSLIVPFLSAIAVVMLLFVASQFAYLFFGASNGAVMSMGYAEYARQGFFELTYASIFVFFIVLLVMLLAKRKEDGKLPGFISAALAVICASNIVILVSGIYRMMLYVDVHGFSIKRLMTLWLMPIFGIATLILLVKCFLPKLKALKAIGLVVIAMVCILAVFNTDRFVAKTRVDQFIKTQDIEVLDSDYFWQLSYSAYPEVDRLLDSGIQLPQTASLSLRSFQDYTMYSFNTSDSYDTPYGYTLDRAWFSGKVRRTSPDLWYMYKSYTGWM